MVTTRRGTATDPNAIQQGGAAAAAAAGKKRKADVAGAAESPDAKGKETKAPKQETPTKASKQGTPTKAAKQGTPTKAPAPTNDTKPVDPAPPAEQPAKPAGSEKPDVEMKDAGADAAAEAKEREEETKRKEEEEKKREAERAQKEEEEQKKKREEEEKREEERKREEEKREKEQQEEQQREEQRRKEEAERVRAAEEEKRKEAESKEAERAEADRKRLEEERRREEEEAAAREAERKREEERKQEEARQKEEAERQEQERQREEARKKEEERQREEERKRAEAATAATQPSDTQNSAPSASGALPSTQSSVSNSASGSANHHATIASHSGPGPAANEGALQHSEERKQEVPDTILEKGQIYFFSRGRVDTEDPDSIKDIARSYIILRPFPRDAALGAGSVQLPESRNRVLALPKKVLPTSGRDRFMVFVELAGASTQQVQERVLQGTSYETQTAGTRHVPPAAPVGEGVYALTEAGDTRRETHLAYMLTMPSPPGDIQKDMGIAEQGSFVLSAKNPNQPSPSGAALPEGPKYSQEIIDSFKTLRWIAAKPAMLDYPNAQFLLIGSSDDHGLQVQGNDADKPGYQELEKLEDEDAHRVEGLKRDHAIFADLGLRRSQHPGLQTSW